MKIVGVCGSLREGSYTRKALSTSLDSISSSKVETCMIDLKNLDIPIFNPDEERTSDLEEAAQLLREADGIILATPMYHGSYSSPLKTFIDHMGFEEFEDKTVGLIGISGGRFPITALEHLRNVCKSLDAWVLPYEAAVPQASQKFEDDTPEEETRNRLEELGKRMVKFSRIEPNLDSFESHENIGAEGK